MSKNIYAYERAQITFIFQPEAATRKSAIWRLDYKRRNVNAEKRMRKHSEPQSFRQNQLSRYVPKLFAHATASANIADKLDKLIGVWEGSKYFDENCYKVRKYNHQAANVTSWKNKKTLFSNWQIILKSLRQKRRL